MAKSISINTFGNHFLYNPEDLPEKSLLYGPGTERPVGFNLGTLCKLFWTVKSFKISAFAPTIAEFFTVFMSTGGSSGTLAGSLTGLAFASLIGSGNFLNGYTKIAAIYSAKIRRSPYGINNGISQANYVPLIGKNKKDPNNINPFALDESIDPRILKSFRNDINEGSIASGAYHKLTGFGGGFALLDFSDILYAKRQYWPKIIIVLGPLTGIGPIFSSATIFKDINFSALNIFGSWNLPVFGGINFMGSIINMYGSISWFPGFITSPTPVFGDITIDQTTENGYLKKPCNRLYWDGIEDKERENYNEQECKNIIQDSKSSSSSS